MNKTATPKLSVNLAVYNTAQYLSASINSILNQSFENFELIIIDDGSTDGSWELLQNFAKDDLRVKLIKQENKGVAAARNLALKHSCGDYIAVMDSDDISLPNRLAVQKIFLDEHPEIDAVGSQWLMIKPNDEEAGIDTHATNSADIETLMYAYYSLHHPTTMIRRKSLLAVGGYSEDQGRLCVDYHLFMKMQLSGCQFANLPFVLFKWRLNPDGITQSKAKRQTSYVIKTRDEGISQLLKASPTQAHAIARKIIYTLPVGSWQDKKIQQLLPDAEDSLLFKTWLSLPVTTPEEYLCRAVVLWLRTPEQYYQDLSAQLQSHKCPWLASLVNAHQNNGEVILPPALNLDTDSSKTNSYLITLFIPFAQDEADLFQRLKQAYELQANADLPIQVLIFSVSTNELPASLTTDDNCQSNNITVLNKPVAWTQALNSAQGKYFIYLEENFRFQIDKFLSLTMATIKANDDLIFLLDKQYFTEAVGPSGKPLSNDSPEPNWNRSTLLAKNRLALSGFIHKRNLFTGLAAQLDECDIQVSRVLARHLANQNQFSIHPGALDYFIPAINLNTTPVPFFLETILDWYMDYGGTLLPASNTWSPLSDSESKKYAHALSRVWQNENLILFRGNTPTIKRYFLDKVAHPMQFPLFRHLLLHDKKTILTSLWHKKKVILLFSASFYCLFNILRNRLISLFIQ